MKTNKSAKRLGIFLLSASIIISLVSLFPAGAAYAAGPQPVITDYSAVFDADYYFQKNPDLQDKIGHDPDRLLKHFISHGMKEGRNGNAAFQVKAYMYNNPDLMAVYGIEDLSSYYIHYIIHGKSEHRKALFNKGKAFSSDTLGSFSTSYNTAENRAVNVELSASKINGIVIAPGESFSYSASVGSRTLENGYVVAPSFARGKVVSSVGGGICQVSSTLYAAMLLSGIPATEHYLHSLTVDYIPRGLDAAIANNYKDLRFENIYDYPIVIHASAKDGTVTVSISKES